LRLREVAGGPKAARIVGLKEGLEKPVFYPGTVCRMMFNIGHLWLDESCRASTPLRIRTSAFPLSYGVLIAPSYKMDFSQTIPVRDFKAFLTIEEDGNLRRA